MTDFRRPKITPPHSLAIGDTVRHRCWAEGETRVIVRLAPFQRRSWNGKRHVYSDDPDAVCVTLDRPIADQEDGERLLQDRWMEAGLVKVSADPRRERRRPLPPVNVVTGPYVPPEKARR